MTQEIMSQENCNGNCQNFVFVVFSIVCVSCGNIEDSDKKIFQNHNKIMFLMLSWIY